MSDSPSLATEFQKKLADDPAFAANAQARLTWWLERSNYQGSTANRYPVALVWEKNF